MSNDDDFHLSVQPLKPAAIPREEIIMLAAERVIEDTYSWKQGKTYRDVRTYSKPKGSKDATGWHCRVSEHTTEEATFDRMWDKLAYNKAANEMEFLPEITKVQKIKMLSPTASIWTQQYALGPLLSLRVFTVLQIFRLDSHSFPQKGMIVSIPIDLERDGVFKLKEKHVQGHYVGVERVMELGDGRTEWRMATAGTPGGFLPTFIVESAMPSTIAKDVPRFMNWLNGSSGQL